jgi:hypothetical protein
VEAGDFAILTMPVGGCPIWEHIPIVGLTAGVIRRLIQAMAMLRTRPLLMVVMALEEDLDGAEDLAGAEALAEEDGGNSR